MNTNFDNNEAKVNLTSNQKKKIDSITRIL